MRNAAAHGTLELYAVVLELLGTERVDRSWVSAAYQADLPPLEKDGRREARIYNVQQKFLAIDQGKELPWHAAPCLKPASWT